MNSRCVCIALVLLLVLAFAPCSASAAEISATAASETAVVPEVTSPVASSDPFESGTEPAMDLVPEETQVIQVIYVPAPTESSDSTVQSLKYSSQTAIAGIFIPSLFSAISACQSSKNQRKLKELELRMPRSYDQFDNLIAAYDKLPRFGDATGLYPQTEKNRIGSLFRAFEVEFHKILPLIPDTELHSAALELIFRIAQNQGHTDQDIESDFFDIISRMICQPGKKQPRNSSSRKNRVLSQEKIYPNELPEKSGANSESIKDPSSSVS